jgi:hypothetical protein
VVTLSKRVAKRSKEDTNNLLKYKKLTLAIAGVFY